MQHSWRTIQRERNRIRWLENNAWSDSDKKEKNISTNPFRYFLYSTNILLQLQNATTLLMLAMQ